MSEASLVFPAQEYAARARALQSGMDKSGFDALLLTAPADIFYLSGFLTRFWESPARPWFLVLPAAGPPVAVIPSIGAALMGRTWIETIHVWQAPDPMDDGTRLLSGVLCDLVPANGTIGLAMGIETSLRMPLGDYHVLTDRIAPRRIGDATEVIQRVREIKSTGEVAKIRRACTIAARAFDRVPQIVRDAPQLDSVFRHFQMALLDEGADWVSYLAGGAGPDGYGDVISPAGAAPLQAGDVLMLDTGAVHDGYFCDFDRNFAIGAPSRTAERTQAALYEATETALTSLRPGQTAREAHSVMDQVLRKHGVTPCSGRFGHGLGVTLTEWPSLSDKDDTELRAGMVLTLEPSAETRDGRILVHEEVVLLQDEGPELLTKRAPANLPEITL